MLSNGDFLLVILFYYDIVFNFFFWNIYNFFVLFLIEFLEFFLFSDIDLVLLYQIDRGIERMDFDFVDWKLINEIICVNE